MKTIIPNIKEASSMVKKKFTPLGLSTYLKKNI